MQIRTITWFCNPGWPLDEAALRQAGLSLHAARQTLSAAGFQVQSVRLATVPFPHVLGPSRLSEAVAFGQALEAAAAQYGIDYVSIGPALPDHPDSYLLIPEVLAATQNVFASGAMTLPQGVVSTPAVLACAEIIRQAATISPDGFGNLRFTALGNVKPGSPFFPAAYHDEVNPAFAFATEAADMAVAAFSGATSLEQARRKLVEAVETQARRLVTVGSELAGLHGAAFNGIDFTLAPFPEDGRSFGQALEAVGVPAVGLSGTLAAAAILADTLDRAQFPRVGFTGLMLPVLEDSVLARRAAEGLVSVTELLLYSSVCGTGLDTVPLPGDATAEQLAAVLLDLAALSQRLNKPLTARLMPIPGKVAGDPTSFDFPYFANSRVLALEAAPLRPPLLGGEDFSLFPRRV